MKSGIFEVQRRENQADSDPRLHPIGKKASPKAGFSFPNPRTHPPPARLRLQGSEPWRAGRQGGGFGAGLDEQDASVIAFVVGHRPKQRPVIELKADGLVGDAEQADFAGAKVADGDNGAADERFEFFSPLG